MHKRLAVLAFFFAALAGCGAPVEQEEAPAFSRVEQELPQCNQLDGPRCNTGYTCVLGACRPRCDTTSYRCSSGLTCCPGVMDPRTGVGSAPYCATACLAD